MKTAGKNVEVNGEGDSKRTVKELRALASWLMESQESERQAISQELYAEIAQYLAMLKLFLDKATNDTSSQKSISGLHEAQLAIKDLLKRVVDLSFDLRPHMLDDMGLLPALLWYFERYTVQTRIQVNFKHSGLNGRLLAPKISTVAYRVVQEALTNIARHAATDEAEVSVRATQTALRIRVEDRGKGFHPSALTATASTGLLEMRERALMLGGKLKIRSTPGTGTLITVEIPLASDKKDSAIKKRVTCVKLEKKSC